MTPANVVLVAASRFTGRTSSRTTLEGNVKPKLTAGVSSPCILKTVDPSSAIVSFGACAVEVVKGWLVALNRGKVVISAATPIKGIVRTPPSASAEEEIVI